MSDFVVHTPEQLAAHDAATSKLYLAALREVQAENARLRAHIQKCADAADELSKTEKFGAWSTLRDYHLAALGETK